MGPRLARACHSGAGLRACPRGRHGSRALCTIRVGVGQGMAVVLARV